MSKIISISYNTWSWLHKVMSVLVSSSLTIFRIIFEIFESSDCPLLLNESKIVKILNKTF